MNNEIKNCENCEEILQGEYCHKCGQKNQDTNLGFFKLFGFLFREFINWDNKVFKTFKYLLFKPGYLSKEYIDGKRASFMHPLRLYFFTSFFYFTLFFALSSDPPKDGTKDGHGIKDAFDTARKEVDKSKYDTTKTKSNSSESNKIKLGKTKISFGTKNSKNFKGGAFIEGTMGEKDDSFIDKLMLKLTRYPEGYVESKLLSYLPKFLFFILPIIALFLNLFYIRNKQFYFYNHFVYVSHNHSYLFALSFILELIPEGNFGDVVNFLAIIYMIIYLYASVKVFYKQSWLKTTLKFFLISFSYLFLTVFSLLTLLFIIFLLN